MLVQKTVKAKIFGLTHTKQALLKQEYEGWQAFLRGDREVKLYSATRQQAERLINRLGERKKQKPYPMILRNDVINIQRRDTKLARFWLKIPIAGVWGGIKVPLQFPHNQNSLVEECRLRESKLIWKGDHWGVHLVFEKEIETPDFHANSRVLGVDFGERHIATSVEWDGRARSNPRFYGTEVRGIRRHHAWLRKRLGERKCLKAIKKVGRRERKKVDAVLHRISKRIVSQAKEARATIVLGMPNGKAMRGTAWGRRFKRIVHSMPYYRLAQFIHYKALWAGVPVIEANEDYSSVECHRCGALCSRPRQDLVVCPHCGSYQADLNASINLAKRFHDHWLWDGAALDTARNFGEMRLKNQTTKESHDLNHGSVKNCINERKGNS